MSTPGVGVLIDTDRLKSSNKKEQTNPYFLEVDGQRYYGSSPEDTLQEAKKGLTRKTQTTNIIPLGVKKQKQTSVTDPMETDLKLLGLSAGASTDEIKSAWKKSVKRAHSNKGGTGNVGALTAARDRLLKRVEAAPAAKPLAIMNAPTAKGGGKMRKSLKRKRVFRKKRSTTRKQLK